MSPTAPCIRCPVPTGLPCRGTVVPRYCELIDPSDPAYDPGYLIVILSESYRTAGRGPPLPISPCGGPCP
jgi:hypothetical protein